MQNSWINNSYLNARHQIPECIPTAMIITSTSHNKPKAVRKSFAHTFCKSSTLLSKQVAFHRHPRDQGLLHWGASVSRGCIPPYFHRSALWEAAPDHPTTRPLPPSHRKPNLPTQLLLFSSWALSYASFHFALLRAKENSKEVVPNNTFS